MSGEEFEERLRRFRKMPRVVRVVYARPRTFISIVLGVVMFLLLPSSLRLVTRLLDWLGYCLLYYIVLVYVMSNT